jgi:hypothetical protein
MFDETLRVELFRSKWLSVGDVHLIDIDRVVRVMKFNYIAERPKLTVVGGELKDVDQFCVMFIMALGANEVVAFVHEADRDEVYYEIKRELIGAMNCERD